mgnify:CR=1 FL=1
MKQYLSKLIKDAIIEAANGMSMDKEHTIRFVERNVPGVSHQDAVKEVNKYFNKKYKVNF